LGQKIPGKIQNRTRGTKWTPFKNAENSFIEDRKDRSAETSLWGRDTKGSIKQGPGSLPTAEKKKNGKAQTHHQRDGPGGKLRQVAERHTDCGRQKLTGGGRRRKGFRLSLKKRVQRNNFFGRHPPTGGAKRNEIKIENRTRPLPKEAGWQFGLSARNEKMATRRGVKKRISLRGEDALSKDQRKKGGSRRSHEGGGREIDGPRNTKGGRRRTSKNKSDVLGRPTPLPEEEKGGDEPHMRPAAIQKKRKERDFKEL